MKNPKQKIDFKTETKVFDIGNGSYMTVRYWVDLNKLEPTKIQNYGI